MTSLFEFSTSGAWETVAASISNKIISGATIPIFIDTDIHIFDNTRTVRNWDLTGASMLEKGNETCLDAVFSDPED